jgi:hypothetical protein
MRRPKPGRLQNNTEQRRNGRRPFPITQTNSEPTQHRSALRRNRTPSQKIAEPVFTGIQGQCRHICVGLKTQMDGKSARTHRSMLWTVGWFRVKCRQNRFKGLAGSGIRRDERAGLLDCARSTFTFSSQTHPDQQPSLSALNSPAGTSRSLVISVSHN